ncbi:MAG TPA: ATP-binding protein [Candidatus Acidoferrales bacterium]|nr:ATP-binding protein [Candidatus Acidoferrales bacterium]
MTDSLRIRLGAVTLALLTVAAIVFAILNFQQRSRFILPDDGVTWMDAAQGVVAWHIDPASPAERAGIKRGDAVEAVRGVPIHRATDVTRVLWRAGPWSEVRYELRRDGQSFQVPVVIEPQANPSSIENYLRITALLYLFIGFFIFVRRWNAPRAIHFYIFCLVSFILYSFHYSGKLNSFDWIIYWGNVGALLLQPALFMHFALVFSERRRNLWGKLAAVYSVPACLLALHVFVATGMLNFLPSIGSRERLDTIELLYLGVYFLLAATILLASYLRASSGILRQQLKWVTGGTFAGILPFFLLYVLPRLANTVPPAWMKLSVFSLALIPLCFGYAIIRYRLMDVDIIFKRGLAYTFATAGVVAVYFAAVAVIGELSHSAWPSGPAGSVIAIVVAAFLFQPLRDWVQARLDHFFYRDRLDYRRTLIEFGRTLTNEVRLEPLLGSVLDRISQTLLVDHLAFFLEDTARPGQFVLSRSMGVRVKLPLDLSFLDPGRPAFERGCLFFESARAAIQETEEVRQTLNELDLNYFIACRFREHTVAMLGLGKTVDGDYLSTDDLELLSTIAGYVAIAIENARLYQSLEQKAAQIERLKDFSENIVESLKIGILTVDLEGRIESWNPQAEHLLEISRGDALGRNLDGILPPDLTAEIAARATTDHVSGIYKLRLDTGRGRQLVINASIAPLLGKGGARLGRLILLDDITQRVRMEEQMLQNEKLTSLGLLAAGVAHEVNTPLAVISNYIQMLAKQIPADDPRQKTIERIVKQTFRASEIVNNLLNFSRTGAAEPVEVDLNAVLEETLPLMQHPFKAAHVNVLRNYTEKLPPVLGSTTRLQQVFLNLFLNARDAMPGGGMLEVRTAAQNGSVEVEVTDTGMGIPPEQLHRIFDPFFTTKATGRGTGLGLSVSYGIIQEHAGKVEVRSTPGKGTSFRLEFPAAQKPVHA